MVLTEKDFLLELEGDKISLKSLFSQAGKYDCPCRRKNMTNADWHNYKNGYMQKVWKLLHERSFKYLNNPSDVAQTKVFNFYNNDVKRIPCYVCRKHYTDFITKNNLKTACSSRSNLCKFLIDLHNDVNKDTKKPIMSYADVFKLYGYEFNNKVYNYPIKHIDSPQPVSINPIVNKVNIPIKPNKPNKPNKNQQDFLFELNKKLISKPIVNNNVSSDRNNIVKRGMMNAIKRGKR